MKLLSVATLSNLERHSASSVEIPESRYGSDTNGLVWGYVFVPGQPGKEVDSVGAAEWLSGNKPPEAFLWLHFSLANTGGERWMRQHLALPETFHEALREEAGSTRLEQDGSALVSVIHDVHFDFTFDPADVSSVTLCVQPDLLLSARLRPLRSVDRLRAAVKTQQNFRSPADLLAHLLRDQAEVLSDIVRKSTTRVNRIEDKFLENRVSGSRRELGSLRRVLVRLQRLLAPEPAALFRLLSRPPAWIREEDLQDLREAAEEFSTAVADSAALVERIRLIQEELADHVNEQSNRTLFVLTVVTVLALPVNVATGLFGMNVGGIPFADFGGGFILIAGALVLLTALLAYLTLGKRKD